MALHLMRSSSFAALKPHDHRSGSVLPKEPIKARAPYLLKAIEIEIELQNIHPRFADQAKRASFDVIVDQRADPSLGQASLLGDARHLKAGRLGRDIRIQPRRRRRDGVDWKRPGGAGGAQGGGVGFQPLDQLAIDRTQIGAARVAGIVGRIDGLGGVLGIGGAGGRRTRMEIARRGEVSARSARSRRSCRHALEGCRLPGSGTGPGRCR